MPYNIEVVALRDDGLYARLADTIRWLSCLQREFQFQFPPPRLRRHLVRTAATPLAPFATGTHFTTTEAWTALRSYRTIAKGDRRYLIAFTSSFLSSTRYQNLFASAEAGEGLAVVTIADQERFTASFDAYVAYYLTRYSLGFVVPDLRNHDDTRSCLFDRKIYKPDLRLSLRSGRLCDACLPVVKQAFNEEIERAIDLMTRAIRDAELAAELGEPSPVRPSTELPVSAPESRPRRSRHADQVIHAPSIGATEHAGGAQTDSCPVRQPGRPSGSGGRYADVSGRAVGPDAVAGLEPRRPRMTKHTILFLAANPIDSDRLALDREARAIQVELERSGHRNRFELVTRWAVEPLDLLRELRQLRPTVVHFSGHGGRHVADGRPSDQTPRRNVVPPASSEGQRGGLFFQGSDGQAQFVSAKALQEAFGAAGASVELIVLSTCYTDVQSQALLAHVNCVVGMRSSVCDDAARTFAIGFYGALGDGVSLAEAVDHGRAAISLQGLAGADQPRLAVRDGIDAEQLVLAADPIASLPDALAAADANDVGPHEPRASEPRWVTASQATAASAPPGRMPAPTGRPRPTPAGTHTTSATTSSHDSSVPPDRNDTEPLVMKNPDIEEGAELPATVIFVLLAGLKDCTDGPMVPSAMRALNHALRGVDASAFVLSTIAGVIIVIPDTASWTVDQTFDALSNAKAGFRLRVGVAHGLVDAVTDTDDEPNLIGPPINTAARLATSTDNPGTLIHETYARFVDGTLPTTHWLHRSTRREIRIMGKPQDPPFTCFVGKDRFEAQPLEPSQPPQWRPAALVAYDLPKFSAGDRAQLRQRFTRLAHAFRRLRQQPPKLAAAAQLSPGGDGGVLVLDGLSNAAAFAARLRELAEIESLDHAEAIAVETRIGVHYGQVTDYVNARGIVRPTGRDLFVADEIAGDAHARDRSGIVVTRQLADSLAGGSAKRLAAEFEPLPPLTSGPAADLERFVRRTSASPL